jgi:hypothetical protein
MPKATLAEALLARITGPTRAAAILGDLLELSATRGRLWFWTAYARTLLSLGWRTAPAAFLLAFASMTFIFEPVIRWLVYRRGSHLMDPGLFGNTHLRLISWNFSIVTAQFLVLALPFVLVRFGLRNRLTQLTCALFLIALPVYSLRPRFMDLSSLLIVVATAAALALPQWRRPMIVLAGMGITAVAWKVPFLVGLSHVYRRHLPYLSNSTVVIYDMAAFALAAIVCVYLNHRLLRQRPPSNSDSALA